MKSIIFTGGGTGGHVFPALALIENLQKDGYEISWIGSKSGIEYQIVQKYNIKFYSIPSGKLRRYFSLLNFIDIFKIIAGFIASFFILLSHKPNLIFSKGGYVTVPPVLIGRLFGIKIFTHESDFSPGLATRINSRFVNKILVPYPETKEYFKEPIKSKVVVTGNPVRVDFYHADRKKGLEIVGFNNTKPLLVVLGGSLGAKEINDLIFESKDELLKKYNIFHQMGEQNFIESSTVGYKSVPFIKENMAHIIKAADLVISRAGAGFIWEFITVGVPSLLIPLIAGSRGDQVLNAEYFQKLGMVKVLKGTDVTQKRFLEELDDYFLNSKEEMVKSISNFSQDSAQLICSLIKESL